MSNPIYNRLIHQRHWPSGRGLTWLGVASGGAGFVTGIAALAYFTAVGSGVSPVPIVFGSALALAGVCLPVGFILAAVMTAQYTSGDDYPLIRISRLPADRILAGYAEGILYRLRGVWTAAAWFAAGSIGAGLLVGMWTQAMSCSTARCVSGVAGYFFTRLAPGVAVVGVGMLIFALIWQSAVHIGVWIGLRWARNEAAMTAAKVLAALAVGALLTSAGLIALIPWAGSLMCVASVLGIVILATGLERRAHEDSIRLIAGQNHA